MNQKTITAAVLVVLFSLTSAACGASKTDSSTKETTTTISSSKCETALTVLNKNPDEVGPQAKANFMAVVQSCTRSQFDTIAGRIYKEDPNGVFSVSKPTEWITLACGKDGSGAKDPANLVCQKQ